MNLKQFLEQKPLYYSEIDYTRMPKAYNSIKSALNIPKIVHIIGTNGKGTTGRYIASAILKAGFSTGHYTSPHILKFNERIWIDGDDVSDEVLETAHKKLLELLEKEYLETLSYFEYTTLLAMVVFEGVDYVVLEAGLGGEWDATAVFENILTVVTPIGFDHQDFLGNDIEKIATTKLNAISKHAIVAKQPHGEVYEIAKRVADKKGVEVVFAKDFVFKADLLQPLYLQENLHLSQLALDFLKIPYTKDSFKDAKMFGRLSKIADNVLVDVGHNPLSASRICESLKPKRYVLIYNSYKDKDYNSILTILKPIIKRVEIIDIDDVRIVDKENLVESLNKLNIRYKDFSSLNRVEDYLVFGSFVVVEEFLKAYNE